MSDGGEVVEGESEGEPCFDDLLGHWRNVLVVPLRDGLGVYAGDEVPKPEQDSEHVESTAEDQV